MTTLLIADDHPLMLNGLVLLLSSRQPHWHILQAIDSKSIKQQLAKLITIDLLIVDRVMPGMDGIKQLAKFWQLRPDLPIVVMSGSDSYYHIREALELGAKGYIPKTLAPEAMIAAIDHVLAGGVFIPKPQADLPESESAIVLSPRQTEILQLLSNGDSNKDIATRLQLSEGTVKIHVTAILKALMVSNRTQAVQRARALGLLP